MTDNTSPTYHACKGLAYPTLATIASCDHIKAKARGYSDGWKMLLDKHDGNEMALFCINLPNALSEAQRQVLLDGLAREYTEFSSWLEFADACGTHLGWVPSRETVAQFVARTQA